MRSIFLLVVLVSLFTTKVFADVNGADGTTGGTIYLDFSTGKSAYFKLLGLDSDISNDKTVYSEFPELYEPNVIIALFDQGFYSQHEELNNLVKINSRSHYHGTLVSSIIMAEAGNDKGFRGVVNPSGAIYGVPFFQISKDNSYVRAAFINKYCRIFDIVNLSVDLSEKSYNQKKEAFDDKSEVFFLGKTSKKTKLKYF